MSREVENDVTIKSAIAALVVAAVAWVAPVAYAADTLVLVQDAPTLAAHPDPDIQPNTTGAVLFFAADVRSTKGKKVGDLIGQITTFDVFLDGIEDEDRFRELVFSLKDGQIVVLGASEYERTEMPNFADDNAPVTAVIVGGTGEYAGARGTVVTKKRKNGTYKHTFTFMD